MMTMTAWTRVMLAGAGALTAAWMCAGPALAQENLDAGKSGAQLYASNCAICHKSAQALNKRAGGLFGLESFLREHYTASREAAAAIAAYLNSVGGGPADHRPAKKKVRSEKKKTGPETKDGKPSETKPSGKSEEKSGQKPAETPSDKKPEKKESGKAAEVPSAAVRG
jgi:cytochrome c